MNLENMIIGQFNSFAITALRAVFKNPKTNFPLLIINGNPGSGKTHLIKETQKLISENDTIKSLTATQLVEDFVTSHRENTHQKFRQEIEEADILIIDDLQDIYGRSGTQIELYRIITSRVSKNKQTVLTTSEDISEIKDLNINLLSHLKLGINVQIGQPNFEERFRIAKIIAAKHQLLECDDLAIHLAESHSLSIRDIEAVMIKTRVLKEIYTNLNWINIQKSSLNIAQNLFPR